MQHLVLYTLLQIFVSLWLDNKQLASDNSSERNLEQADEGGLFITITIVHLLLGGQSPPAGIVSDHMGIYIMFVSTTMHLVLEVHELEML